MTEDATDTGSLSDTPLDESIVPSFHSELSHMPASRLLVRGSEGGRGGRPPTRWHLASSLRQQIDERIAKTTLILAMLHTLSISISGLALAAGAIPYEEARINFAIAPFWISGGLLVGLVAHKRWLPRRWLLVSYAAYLMLIASLLCRVELSLVPEGEELRGISWVCLVLLGTQLAVPMTLLLHALVATTAALGPPIVAIVMNQQGLPLPSPAELAAYFLPIVGAGFIGAFLGSLVNALRQRADRAAQQSAYRLDRELGRGGMGEVWLAHHEMLARPVALKLIRSDKLQLPDDHRERIVGRFRREAQLTARLSSRHTVELYDFGVSSDGMFYYVMELLEGLSLDALIRRHGPVPASRCAAILEQACLSLAEAHAFGLVHRDIKPANLMVCRGLSAPDFVKVLDFGLVKVTQEPSQEGGNGVAGTPSFIPPEQVLAKKIDGRADLYGLGCVAYWLLTGQRVFEAKSAADYFDMHLHQRPLAVSLRAKQAVPPALDAIIMQCLEKRPEARTATALELYQQLRATQLSRAWTRGMADQWWSRATASAPLYTPNIEAEPGFRTLTYVAEP